MSEPDALVVFTPSGKRGRFPRGTLLLQAARTLGVDVDSVCGGRALCGRCQVLVMEGDFPKHGLSSRAANLSVVSAAEQSFSRRRPLAAGRRLSCSTTIQGDLVVDVPPDSQVHRQVVRKAVDARPITLDPVVHLHYVEVREPDMHDPSGDLQRLLEALHREWEFGALRCDLAVLQGLQAALRKGSGKSPSRCTPAHRSSASGRDFTSGSTAWRWTWARPPSRPTCAILRAAKWSLPAAR